MRFYVEKNLKKKMKFDQVEIVCGCKEFDVIIDALHHAGDSVSIGVAKKLMKQMDKILKSAHASARK